MRRISLFALLPLTISLGAFAEVISFPPGAPGSSPLTEAQMNEALGHLEILARERFREEGRELVGVGHWENPYFAAYAQRQDAVDSVHVWGGLVRTPGMTFGALAFVVCHELGHHRGGAPYQSVPDYEWASSEGEADDFAARCLGAWQEEFSGAAFSGPKMEALRVCGNDLPCARTTQAAWEFFEAVQTYSIERIPLNPLTPDPTVVSSTAVNSYPGLQCRLDTVVAGATGRPRPSCWFAP